MLRLSSFSTVSSHSQSKPPPAFINKMNKLSNQNKNKEKIMCRFSRKRNGTGRGLN